MSACVHRRVSWTDAEFRTAHYGDALSYCFACGYWREDVDHG